MTEIEEVKARLDIVDVIGQYVHLQKAGRTFKAPCPFHSERTPSFIVSPERQSWHCFGACGTGGDLISFVMRKEGMEFPEALAMLAQRAGVPLRERQASEQGNRQRERLQAANEAAAVWCRQQLLTSDAAGEARQYVERRGIDAATAETFALGYSPPAWEAMRKHLRERDFSDAELLAAGLLVEGDSGPHDRFRGRLMFPIRDLRGRLTGFGARALDDGLPKYLNTAQTAVFDKGSTLYGLDLAAEAIRREGQAVIVEGYMDVIAAHQHGFTNVVAAMGTALTERQVALLKRHARKAVVALDPDMAGSEATLRALSLHVEMGTRAERFSPHPESTSEEEFQRDVFRIQRGIVEGNVEVDVAVATLPPGKDPDELIRESPAAWRDLVETAKPLMEFWFETAAGRRDLTNPKERSELARELVPIAGIVRDPVVRAHYLQRLARLALVSEEELSGMLSSQQRRQAPRAPGRPPIPPPQAAEARGDTREEFLLALLLQHPQLRTDGLAFPEQLLWESENRQLLTVWKGSEVIDLVKAALPHELLPHLERLIVRKLPDFTPKEAQDALEDCRRRLERRQLAAEKQATAALLATQEEEMGASALAEAALAATPEDERTQEVVSLHIRDMEAGLRLHRRERSVHDGEAVETNIDG
ncbi:MAG: DNA primase [Dehalococcoidia bacterium]